MTDSKLAKQQALPRKKMFREPGLLANGSYADSTGTRYKAGKLQPPKAKRKSQAKVKR